MITQGQKPMLDGGRVVLYSRSRHGNYPLATYAFHLGLRGDDRSVANDVNLLFGNTKRDQGFDGERIDKVPGVPSNGATGMDGKIIENADGFRVTCLDGSQHRIEDLGAANFNEVLIPPAKLDSNEDVENSLEILPFSRAINHCDLFLVNNVAQALRCRTHMSLKSVSVCVKYCT